ncbi:MAG: hypothetical protein ACREQJ_04030 [Candidatus Binatia bacterium]
MKTRRSIFVALGATLAAAAFWKRRAAAPEFALRTPPGNRSRTIALGERQLHVREDLLRSGWLRDLRFHDREKKE